VGNDAAALTVTYAVTDLSGNAINPGPTTPPGQYLITATLSGSPADNYQVTPGTLFVVTVGADTDASGGQNVAFWDNKGNQTYVASLPSVWASLDGLNLVNQDGTAFDPTSVNVDSTTALSLDTWLQKANAKNVAYWVSAQLAAADLNMLSGKVLAGDIVSAANLLPYRNSYNLASGNYGLTSGGFIEVQDLIKAANDALGLYLSNPTAYSPYCGSDFRNYLLALAQSLQAVNNNASFIQTDPATVAALDTLFAAGLVS
jgi:hypothetical protein